MQVMCVLFVVELPGLGHVFAQWPRFQKGIGLSGAADDAVRGTQLRHRNRNGEKKETMKHLDAPGIRKISYVRCMMKRLSDWYNGLAPFFIFLRTPDKLKRAGELVEFGFARLVSEVSTIQKEGWTAHKDLTQRWFRPFIANACAHWLVSSVPI